MKRREFLASNAAFLAQPGGRSGLGLSPDCFVIARPPRTALDYLEKGRSVGAGGVQTSLANFEPDYLKKVRDRAAELGMYLEIVTALPEPDTSRFENVVRAAKEAGAYCMRSVCLSGRRYETFSSLEQWDAFVVESKAKLARAVPILEKHRMPLGLENHKDWTVEDMVPLLKSYSSQYLGACIDFGNSISLLDDPIDVVESLAPFVINTHIKDMAVEEYEDGFLLAEVALGQGLIDLKRCVSVLNKARPGVKYSLDMLTRDPLKIPCLTDKYWITWTQRHPRYLARTLAWVRKSKPAKPLARLSAMDKESQLRLELENVTQSVAYARDQLGIRA